MEEQSANSGATWRIDAAASPPPRPFDLPRNQQPRRRSSLLLLAALGVLLAAMATLGDVVNVGWNVERTTTATEQFAARNLVLDMGSGTITLVGSDAADTTVDMTQHGWGWSSGAAERALERARPTITQNGDTLHITTPARSAWMFLGRSPRVDVRVTLPRAATVQASTGSGEITINHAADATLALQTSSGDIAFSGSLRPNTPQQAATGSGSISLQLPADTSVIVDAETGSGSVNSDWSVEDNARQNAAVNARETTLRLRTGSGDIAVTKH